MARLKGTPKTGGRVKGTPNKHTLVEKTLIANIIGEYVATGKMSSDFEALEPRDRISIAEKLMQYCVPKMQATKVDMSVSTGEETLEIRLAKLANSNE